ncbi:MAG: HlyD family efflux transporter periplasmic adaptor subunit [Chloroflexi bacterium]|nr:MAG: HlyD family efflux transporter periplasmic adaptor subunit [Chloroflexota bacterium]
MNLGFFVTSWPGRIAALALAGVVAGGVIFVARAQQPAAKPELRTTTVTKGNVTQTVSVSGSVAAQGQAKLAFKTGGRISEIYVGVGQAVSAGQSLAKLDTADLETALATAQQNLANAQASYQKAVLAAQDTQRQLDETRRSTASDIANAQTALTKARTNYATAKANFTSLTNALGSDLSAYLSSMDPLRAQIAQVLADLPVTATSDVNSARNSLNSADGQLASVQGYAGSVLTSALNEYLGTRDQIVRITGDFDGAIAASSDTSSVAASYQNAQLSFNLALSKLQAGMDSVTGAVSSAQTSVASAVASMNTQNSRSISAYDKARADLAMLQSTFATQSVSASAAKTKLTQASSSLSTIGDSVTGTLVNAITAVSSAQDRATTSIRQAESAVANIPFNLQTAQSSVDNANNTVTTARQNLDNAILTAPSAGIVAAVANQIGEFVAGGGNNNSVFITLTNTTSMVLHGTVGEADIAKLKIAQVANVTVDALTGQRMTGRVTSLDPVATISQGVPVYGIDVAIDIPSSSLKAGMSGTASVILASKQGVLTVPNTTIRTVNGQRGVQVLKDGEVVDTPVQFGIANDTVTEVVSGLAEGDVVVIPQARAGASAQPNRGPGGGPVFIGR